MEQVTECRSDYEVQDLDSFRKRRKSELSETELIYENSGVVHTVSPHLVC